MNTAKLCKGPSGLVISEMNPTIVVTPASKTATITSFKPEKTHSSYFSLVISPSTLLIAM